MYLKFRLSAQDLLLRSNTTLFISHADKSSEAPHADRPSRRNEKKERKSLFFEVEVARVELASKQGARRLSTRLVVTYSFSESPADNRQTQGPAPQFRTITEAHIALSSKVWYPMWKAIKKRNNPSGYSLMDKPCVLQLSQFSLKIRQRVHSYYCHL